MMPGPGGLLSRLAILFSLSSGGLSDSAKATYLAAGYEGSYGCRGAFLKCWDRFRVRVERESGRVVPEPI